VSEDKLINNPTIILSGNNGKSKFRFE